MKENNNKEREKWISRLSVLSAFVLIFSFCVLAEYSLMIPVLIFLVGLQLHFTTRAPRRRLYLNLSLLMTLLVFTAYIIKTYTTLSFYYIPVAAVSMLVVLLFKDLWLTFLMAVTSSLLVTVMLNGSFGMMFTFLFGSLVGAYSVRDSRTRGQVITAGLFIGAIHLVCLVLMFPDHRLFLSKAFSLEYIYPLAANGMICVFFVIGTLKVFEYTFDAISNFTLLELSDFNQPLLKRMVLEAPGTYHHSLVVSNLAEAAADAIGADALLTRVGAYYHDIGKMAKSEYFTENQMIGGNKHDNIEPSMSRLVLLNHVKEGMELARKHKLNQAIIDFIPQHHGTGLMYFFYQRAVEEAKEGETVDQSIYRYSGPKPQTRETAITLLADSVEGATRSLDEPSPQNIEETVKKVINNKFIDGQLDECPLTLKEIDKITATFTRILSAMYHSRVKYPEKKNGGSVGRKSAKDTAARSPADQESGPDGPSPREDQAS